jgi:type I restriction enzyme S subunit
MTADTLTDTVATTMHTHPAHWSAVALGAVCALRGENAQPPFDTAINYVGLEHLDSGNPRLERWESASSVVSAKARFQAGDVLYGKLRPYLDKAALAEFDGVCSTDILVLKPMASLDSAFLSFLVHTRRFIEEAVRSTGGVNLPRTSWNALSVAVFPLPPLAEQRAIACILRAAQDAIAARRRQVTLERERKAALMQRLFTHGVRGEPTKQTEIGEMPQSWQVVRLGDALVKTQYGLSLRGESVGDYPILRMNNLVEGHVDTADLQYVTTDDTILRQFQLAHGDILFNRTNSYELVGKTALFDLPGKFLFASYLIRVIPLPEILLSGFLNAYFNTARTQQRLRMLASRGVSQSNISASKLQEFFIPLPSLDEQRAIADTLAACDTHIAALEREIALHEELFRALLEELMSGRLSALPLVEGKEVND